MKIINAGNDVKQDGTERKIIMAVDLSDPLRRKAYPR